MPRLLLGEVLGENRIHHLVHHILLLEEGVVGLGLQRRLLIHLLVQRIPHRSPVLHAQVIAVGLRLQSPLAIGLHLARHDSLRLGLLGDKVSRLLYLCLALLVHVRRLELLLQLTKLL